MFFKKENSNEQQNFNQPLLQLHDGETSANSPRPTINTTTGESIMKSNQSVYSNSHPRFQNFDDKEEATCIKELTYLQFRPFMFYVIFPFVSILTAFILPIFVYWKKNLQLRLFYKKVDSKNQATHVLVEGVTGNIET